MMNKIRMILAAVIALVVTSCIEHHVVLTVNKDGSGTITEETTMGGAALGMMGAFGGEAAGNPMDDLVDEEEAKKKAALMGEGVTLDKVEAIDANGRKGGKAIYSFKDINQLKYSYGDSISEMGEDAAEQAGEEVEKSEPIEFSLKDGVLTVKNKEAAEAIADEEGGEEDAAEEEMDEASLAMAKQMMGDMKMSFKIEIPGGIEETNATNVEGNTVTMMEMHMGKLLENPENFKKLNSAKPGNAADMQEALKGIDGVKVESKEEITIKLK
ncbi:hypothetical protein [Haloferula rosea]|uniref:Lipoprotein n=1 Tax=Haloferula rosea TaxID=490093 RepID=A0A934RC26_9BACT|nr:hypothetical protein [Haloferula rosea]MBK1826857.1 hypothetical protein [Haloferula rosea]